MKTTVLISSLLLGLCPAFTLAQGQPGGPPPRDPLADALDVDKDGVISEEEMKNAAEALAGLDQDKDGDLSRDELKPPRPPAPEGEDQKRSRRSKRRGAEDDRRHPVPPLVSALDRNGDGEISAREMKRAARALKRLDRNRDDELSGEELHPPRPPPRWARRPALRHPAGGVTQG